MKTKKGVKIFGSQPEIIWCDMMVSSVYERLGYECVITSGVEGNHGSYSHHFKGFARDYRINNVPQRLWEDLVDGIKNALTDEFQVVLEKNHIHVEFDPKTN